MVVQSGILLLGILTYLHLGLCQDDFRLFLTDAGGKIYTLNSDLSINRSLNAGSQVVGIAADPSSTHDSYRVVFSTIANQTYPILDLSIENLQATTLYNSMINEAYVDRMAIEPVSGNIYYSAVSGTGSESFIGVLSPYNENTKIIGGLQSPRDILIHPERRKLYYTDHGDTHPHIGWSYLDGSSQGILIDDGDISWPNGLAIDFNTDKLYWSDGSYSKIESYDLNTGIRQVVLQLSQTQLMDILIDGEYLYYLHWENPEITRVRLSDMAITGLYAISGATRLDAMTVYSPNTRQLPEIIDCSERYGLGDCSNICLPSAEGHVCACADGQQLTENGKTCDSAKLCPASIIGGTISEACYRHHLDVCEYTCIEGFLQSSDIMKCENGEWNVSAPCTEVFTQPDGDFRLFVTDAGGRIYTLNSDLSLNRSLNAGSQVVGIAADPNSTHDDYRVVYSTLDTEKYPIMELFIESLKATTLYSSIINEAFVDRMVIEPVSGNIYYTGVTGTAGESFIAVLSPFRENRKIIEGLNTPRDIIIHPARRKLYYTDHGDVYPHVGWSYLDGSSHGTLIDDGNIKWPNGLAIDFNADKLYWSDGSYSKIESYDLNTGTRQIVLQLSQIQLMDILIDGDFLYYLHWGNTEITRARLSDMVITGSYLIEGATRLDAMAVYSSYTRRLPEITDCSERDGLADCSNICLPSVVGYVCACADGQQLNENGKTCDNAKLCPASFTWGTVAANCLRHNRDVCQYVCNEGSQPTSLTSQWIRCENERWNVTLPCSAEEDWSGPTDNYRLFVGDSSGYIYALNSSGAVVQVFEAPQTDKTKLAQVVGVGVDPHATSVGSSFIYSTIEPYSINDQTYYNYIMYRRYVDSAEPEVLFTTTNYGAFVDRFAVDPISKNIYFTGVVSGYSGYSFLAVLSPGGDFVPILVGLTSPRDIVLHPLRRLLFWTDHASDNPHIGFAYMDGTSAGYLLTTDNAAITWPNGLAIDTKNDILYWSDGSEGKIETYNLLDNSRSTLLSVPNSQLMDILLDGNYLYYLDWKNMGVITKLNIDDVSDISTLTLPGVQRLDAMALYSSNTQDITGSTECADRNGQGDCSSVCLPNNQGHLCSCNYGVDIMTNQKTCIDAILCPESIPAGGLSETCLRHNLEVCAVTCETGYSPIAAKLKCENEVWNVTDPCRLDCSQLTAPLDGELSTHAVASGTVVTVSCFPGYTLFDHEPLQCQDGTWKGSLGTCKKDCPVLTARMNGMMTSNAVKVGSTVKMFCSQGFTLFGNDTVECQNKGIWRGTLGDCLKDCSHLTAPAHGELSSNDITSGTTITVSCTSGYSLFEHETMQCVTGTWEGSVGTCKKDCPILTAPEEGVLTSSGVKMGTTVSVICNQGYISFDSELLECQDSETWGGSVGFCRKGHYCPKLAVPSNSELSTNGVTSGTVVTISCTAGFTLFNNVPLLCKDGTWEGSFGTCKKDCPILTAPIDGLLTSNDVKVGTMVSSLCNPGYTFFGNDLLECQDGGTWNGSVGVCKRDCPMLTVPVGGVLSTNVVTSDTMVTVSCTSGFTLFGNETLLCQSGTWEGSTGICKKDCPALPAPVDVVLSSTDVKVGTLVIATCKHGHTYFGSEILECQNNGTWSGIVGICEKDCPELTVPEDGELSTNVVTSGTLVTVSCTTGFTLFGNETLLCQNGTWKGSAGSCKKDCPALPAPVDVVLSSTDVKVGTLVIATCKHGHTYFGSEILECQNNGTWSGIVGICEKDCPELTDPEDGELSTNVVTSGTLVTVSCTTGFTLFGNETLLCQNGTWKGSAGSCKKDCPALPAPVDVVLSSTDVKVGTLVIATCKHGHTYFGSEILECQNDGTWSGIVGICEKDCPELTDPEDGELSTNVVTSGTLVTVSCTTGFTLFGNETLLCQNGTWKGSAGSCKKDCPGLPAPVDVVLSSTDVKVGTLVIATCKHGHTYFGSEILECQNDGTWNGIVGICEKDCPELTDPEDGELSTNVVTSGTLVTVSCTTGFTLFGNETLLCQNGTWKGSAGSCKKDCPALPAPVDVVLSSTDVKVGTLVIATCKHGHIYFGSEILECQNDGTWSGIVGICEKDCPELTDPEDGELSTNVVTSGTLVTVSCTTGFTLFGNETLLCQNGTWKGSAGSCKKDCPQLPKPNDGYLSNNATISGTSVEVLCNDGSTLFGDTVLQCGNGGTWSGSVGLCIQVTSSTTAKVTSVAQSSSTATPTGPHVSTALSTAASPASLTSEKASTTLSPSTSVAHSSSTASPTGPSVSTSISTVASPSSLISDRASTKQSSTSTRILSSTSTRVLSTFRPTYFSTVSSGDVSSPSSSMSTSTISTATVTPRTTLSPRTTTSTAVTTAKTGQSQEGTGSFVKPGLTVMIALMHKFIFL